MIKTLKPINKTYLINSGITGSTIPSLRVERAINCATQWCNSNKKICKQIEQLNAINEILEWIKKARAPDPFVANIYPKWIYHGFVMAFRHLILEHSYLEGIKATIAEGGNTSANAMSVGGLLGVLHGMYGSKGIPKTMWEKIHQADLTEFNKPS